MGLIKSANAPLSLAPFSMADIERQAKTILLRARQQADQLLAAAQSEAETLKQQAIAEGRAEGHRQGLAQGTEQGRKAGHDQALAEHRAQLQQAIQSLNAAMTSIQQHRGELESQALAEVVELALAVARRVTKRQALVDPEVLIANLREAMKMVIQATAVRIAVHPSQRQTLDAALPQLQLQWPQLNHVKVIDDPSLAPGGCRVFMDHGQVDASLDEQLDRIAAELLPSAQSAS